MTASGTTFPPPGPPRGGRCRAGPIALLVVLPSILSTFPEPSRAQVGAQVEDGASHGEVVEGPATRPERRFVEIRRFHFPEARQGPAADEDHIYAVTNRAIGKYDKETGERVGGWEGPEDGPIVHLNDGVVIDGRLYATHSNYPDVPMLSSVEIFDPETMEHMDSHSFGFRPGSATWVDRKDGFWWVGFANYEGRGGAPGRGPAWTRVVKFDDGWREVESFAFPPEVVERFGTRSNSGGGWGPDGFLYATGHDLPELYVLRLPDQGSVLELVEIVPVPAEGQAIDWDPAEAGLLYTLIRSRREIVISRMEER